MYALVSEAAAGSAAIAKFIATRFDMADTVEADGDRTTADEMRESWSTVLTSLSTVDRALAAEAYVPAVLTPA